ncbi:unnamed protein product [Mytilus coruscus]|uniref:Uncharacterized protein n=1 Tax=Mytilus coruscus TaxID=42192 RepID=A0A6J8EIA3_MYTCO|nr:unnamed protein product [Mytilus coruscus]
MDGDDDRLDSDSREAPGFSLLSADTAGDKLKKKSSNKSSARTSSLEKVSKKKRTSKKDALQAVYDEKLTNINRDLDVRSEISISIGDRERNELDIHSDDDDYSVSGNSPVRGNTNQMSKGMNIISMLYMQQTLGSLLKDLEEDNVDKSTACQTVKDIFAMSTKSLDEPGRSGAFFHLIRRKAAAYDSGLSNIKDLSSRCQYLPLSEEGVFGKGLEISLEKRKKQKDQLCDLLPEFSKKRKFEVLIFAMRVF